MNLFGYENMNLQYYDSNSFVNDFIYPNELYTLINFRLSSELRGYQLIVYEDNKMLVHPEHFDWAIHVRNDRGFWNKMTLGNSFEYFSLYDLEIQNYIVLKWFSLICKEVINETLNDKLLLEDSFSERSMLVKQMINVSKKFDVFNPDSKYLTKEYWSSIPNFVRLS